MTDWYPIILPLMIAIRMWQDGLSRWDSVALLGYSSIPLIIFGLDRFLGREDRLISELHYAFMSAVFIAIGFLWGRKRGKVADAP